MTGTYDWNPMPHKVDISCPSCRQHSIFEFAEVMKIKLKRDVPFFQDSKIFDYELLSDSCGHKWHAAIFYAGLHGGSVNSIHELPDGYKPEAWSHSGYLYRNHGLDIGSVICANCNLGKKHVLSWPSDAYFSIEYKGEQLWAFNRESAIELKDFILSSDRNVEQYKWRNYLLHVPTIFKTRNAREKVVSQIEKLLIC